MRVNWLGVQTEFDFSINKLGRGVQKDVARCGNIHCKPDGSMKSVCKFNEVVKAASTVHLFHFNVVNEL